MISVRGLHKHYEVHKRAPGLGAAVRSLLHREYTTVRAVDGIDFEIAPHERVGFLGPNGAGKTTTLKVLSGLLHPTGGEVRVDGHEPRRREEAFLREITLVLGQKQQLLWDLPPSETFDLNRAIYGIDRRQYTETLGELVTLLEIGDVIKRPTRQLSLGERMKCELAAALIHRPKLLFLDEPTIGLDVSMQSTLRNFIRAYNEQRGATIILTSHNMADVALLCPRVILIDHGKIVFDGQLDDLVRKTKPEKRIVLRFAAPAAKEAVAALGTVVSQDAGSATLSVPQADVSRVVARALASLSVEDLNVTDPPLEEIMADVFGRGRGREGGA
ncbi:MAG TPA: ATP-binding cassette domain-containing protein [Polyangiaceae bacterium]|nr:ATP-binding cassette domain-containing protein [Polyangiaceae bacterium]